MKKPTVKDIHQAFTGSGAMDVRRVNEYLQKNGRSRIDAATRDKAKQSFDTNQIPKRPRKPGSGGSRKGSGRKAGATTKKTREIANKLAESDEITPLEYMLNVMRTTDDDLKAQYEKGDIDAIEYATKLKMQIQRRDNAAEKAATFLHPRLASIQANIKTDEQAFWVDHLAELADQ